jgi:hypothetical protein
LDAEAHPGDDMALKHMVGADPIMGQTFRTPWWDPTYDAVNSWAPLPEPSGESYKGSSKQSSLSQEALDRLSRLKAFHSTEMLNRPSPRLQQQRKSVTFEQPETVELPPFESDDFYERYFGSDTQLSSKYATEAARKKRQDKKQLASALYDSPF